MCPFFLILDALFVMMSISFDAKHIPVNKSHRSFFWHFPVKKNMHSSEDVDCMLNNFFMYSETCQGKSVV
jgi:hypothetical protein